MPIYVYQRVDDTSRGNCEVCCGRLEVIQKMNDEPLTTCPECSEPVERVPSAFSVGKPGPSKRLLTDSNLEKHGFTRLTKQRNGNYKVSGADPAGIEKIRKPSPE